MSKEEWAYNLAKERGVEELGQKAQEGLSLICQNRSPPLTRTSMAPADSRYLRKVSFCDSIMILFRIESNQNCWIKLGWPCMHDISSHVLQIQSLGIRRISICLSSCTSSSASSSNWPILVQRIALCLHNAAQPAQRILCLQPRPSPASPSTAHQNNGKAW